MSRPKTAFVKIKAPGPIGNAPGTKVFIDGEDIADKIMDLTLHMGINDTHHMDVTYHCWKGVEFEGRVIIHHQCGLEPF